MSIFGKSHPETVINIEKIIVYCGAHKEPDTVHLILKQKINNSIYHLMALSIASNQKVLGTLGLVDSTNPNTVVTGTFSNVSATSDNPAAFAASIDADNDVVVTGVAAGAGNLSVSALSAYVDSTGAAQSVTKTVSIPVTITQVITADQVDLVVNFGNPIAQ